MYPRKCHLVQWENITYSKQIGSGLRTPNESNGYSGDTFPYALIQNNTLWWITQQLWNVKGHFNADVIFSNCWSISWKACSTNGESFLGIGGGTASSWKISSVDLNIWSDYSCNKTFRKYTHWYLMRGKTLYSHEKYK